MAAAIPYIALGISAVSTVKQMSAANKAERLANQNAANVEAQTKEEARRLKLEQQQTESMSRARAAASGSGGASQGLYQQFMIGEHAKELAWLKKSGSSRASSVRAEGRYTASMGRINAFGTLGQGITSFYGNT